MSTWPPIAVRKASAAAFCRAGVVCYQEEDGIAGFAIVGSPWRSPSGELTRMLGSGRDGAVDE